MTSNQNAYHAMLRKSLDLGQPKNYTDDLFFYDRLTLGLGIIPERPPDWPMPVGAPFAWLVRNSGTELFYIGGSASPARRETHLINMGTLEYYLTGGGCDSDTSCWWWDGVGPTLSAISIGEVAPRLYEAIYKLNRPTSASRGELEQCWPWS